LFLPVLFKLLHFRANIAGISQLASLGFAPTFLDLRSNYVRVSASQPFSVSRNSSARSMTSSALENARFQAAFG